MLIIRLGRDVNDPLFACILDMDRVDPAPYRRMISPSTSPSPYALHDLLGTVLCVSWRVDSVEVPTHLDRVLGSQMDVLLMSWPVDLEAASIHQDHDALHSSPYASTHHHLSFIPPSDQMSTAPYNDCWNALMCGSEGGLLRCTLQKQDRDICRRIGSRTSSIGTAWRGSLKSFSSFSICLTTSNSSCITRRHVCHWVLRLASVTVRA